MGTTDRPLLFVDIDGVLNPYGGPCPDGYEEDWLFPAEDEPVRICSAHSPWLHELAQHYDLAWGTSWSEPDRRVLGTVLNLPAFVAAVELPSGRFDAALKVPAVDLVAGNRALAWIDDLLSSEAHSWAETRGAPTLLVPIAPAEGLRRHHVDQLVAWAASV